MKKIHQFKATWKLIQPKSNRPNTSIINASINSVFVVIDTERVPTLNIIAGIIKTAFTILKIITPDGITTDTSPKIIKDDTTTDANIIVMADVTTNATN
jgi:hypothetical protein